MEKCIDFSNEQVTHVKNDKVEYLTFKSLEKYSDKITAVVTLKHGGISEGVFNSLNFRMAGSDKKENVLENLNIIFKSIKRKFISYNVEFLERHYDRIKVNVDVKHA